MRTATCGWRSLRELRDYCYVVAGIVGEMLTELFLLDAEALAPFASRLRRRSRFFGEALQLVNILKDASSDATEGRVYLPAGIDRARVFALARRDLDVAAAYVGTLQFAGAPDGFVAFTGSPAVLAPREPRPDRRGCPGGKLTRAEVGALHGADVREPRRRSGRSSKRVSMRLEARFHRGPLVVDDPVVDRVAHGAVPADAVAAQHAFAHAADPLDRPLRAHVARVGFQRDAMRGQAVECVAEQAGACTPC